MNDFPFDHDSGKSMGRHRSNAKAEAGIEHRKLREEIERLRAKVAMLEQPVAEAEARALERFERWCDRWENENTDKLVPHMETTRQLALLFAKAIRDQASATPKRQKKP